MLLEDEDGLPAGDKFSILSHDYAVELALGRAVLEHIDPEVKANKGVTDGKDIHFAQAEKAALVTRYPEQPSHQL